MSSPILFTDIDGTLAHKESDMMELGQFELSSSPALLLLPRQVQLRYSCLFLHYT